ncbi:glycosyltransferase 87 family protein [Stieleria sp. JC731]|uniref:glycosyltransferase 87 family protein n=1 Tax=Pirellulaceae TaxID=2691357 RepID=UPI001E49F5CE|nr:glycosyltransferase 87 family protein [Stieleria sp. JC731]MCC9600483.1 glycosyltransferase 87 family protein [Stieleria sp. JC731]
MSQAAKPTVKHKPVAALAVIAFIALISLTALRVVKQYQSPGPFDPTAQGMCDFHNGVYFPTRALLAGVSPYGTGYANSYPVARQIPFFSPGILLLHAPLAVLPLHVAEVIYFVFSVALIIAIAMVCAKAAGKENQIEWIASIATLLVASRGGHITLFDGYFTFELVLATYLSVQWAKSHPTRAGIALAVVSAKPTYILPLGFLLLARGNFKALLIGASISILIAGLPFGYLAYQESIRGTGQPDFAWGIGKLISDIEVTQQVHMNMPDESPVLSWTRLDLLAAASKWTGTEPSQLIHLLVMFVMLSVPMVLLAVQAAKRKNSGLGGSAGALITLAMLSSLYHQSYDALLLMAPIAASFAGRTEFWKSIPPLARWSCCLLMLIPLFNLLSTRSLLLKLNLGQAGYAAATSLNGFAIAIALLIVCFHTPRTPAEHVQSLPG